MQHREGAICKHGPQNTSQNKKYGHIDVGTNAPNKMEYEISRCVEINTSVPSPSRDQCAQTSLSDDQRFENIRVEIKT